MYFIVYIIKAQKYVVIPERWILNVEDHFEKFLNYGVNSNQKFVCFWSNSPAARDENGIIDLDSPADFFASRNSIFPADGCYDCQIRKAKGNFSSIYSQIFRVICWYFSYTLHFYKLTSLFTGLFICANDFFC